MLQAIMHNDAFDEWAVLFDRVSFPVSLVHDCIYVFYS